ncbi:SDR family oxidoreductase [Streptacidiphilus rugosus]|uniref:SDR family oxidoreductase n=1 Tax=Streptacidiphilus rugosus TaxID=405783 RepID=UPI000565BA6C|nr:SDR family oxidoreductase [Streptacidiphilus rugosus]
MTTHTQRKVAVVTGGSRGIGRGCVERLAEDGFAVVVGYATNAAEAGDAVAAVTARGGEALAVSADVGDESAVAALFDAAEEAFGGIDAVVHAAARMTLAPLADFDLKELDEMLRINVRGTYLVGQQAARRLRPGGSLVNFSSSVIGRALPNYTGYAGSKGAVEAMTFILAHELRGREINVNAIAPGPTGTAMFLEGKTKEQIEFFTKAAPLERLGTPSDIAQAVAFLTSPAGHWVNGQTIRVNGGLH